MNESDLKQEFAEYDRQVSIQNSRIGAILAIILMPFGFSMDYFVYPEAVWDFLWLRLLGSLLIAVVLGLLMTAWGKRHFRFLGMAWYMIPALIIASLIYFAKDPVSPYYAGFNLVLLGVGLILPWTYKEILLAVTLILGLYLAAYFLPNLKPQRAYLVSNLFFLVSTGVVVVTGSYFHSRLRHREFVLRFELDQSRRMVEESNRKLIELDQVKSRFFANISHELRTPLTLLLAPLESLLQHHGHGLSGDARSLLETMRGNGMRLLKLINDLLDLVRLESGRMEIRREPLQIREFVHGLMSAVRQVAEDKRIHLEVQVADNVGTVLTDRDKLEKVLLNLQFNALKFTAAGGRVELSAVREDDQLVLKVRDTGLGISKENLPYVFDRFWQADDSSKRKYQGVGIGLSLVKELVEVQKGTVTVESEMGRGTTFTIRLPFVEAAAVVEGTEGVEGADEENKEAMVPEPIQANGVPSVTPAPSSQEWLSNLYRRAELFPAMTSLRETIRPVEVTHQTGQPKILIADDEPDMLRFLGSQLRSHYQVFEAVDGQQAIDKAVQFLPDMILLDMMMPEKDGLQACRELRERVPTQSIPIILLTARADEETKLAALSAGASDFLAKPFSTTELHVRIKNLVESHEYQRKLSKQNQVLEQTIDQLKETETQLVQTEKLASLGRLSAGIIHEINNPLNFATTGLFTLRKAGKLLEPAKQEEYSDTLKDVEEALGRVKTIVSDLRSFSHHENDMMEEVLVTDLVETSLRFLSHEWKDEIQIEQNLTAGQVIWANKNKLIQVFVNLLHNAVDALKAKTFPENERPCVRIESVLEPGLSRISVWDNGSGIDPAHIDKIFDPFYTTKDVGEGMGLGLSICYRIIQGYDGTISVQSEPGRFAKFSLEFPVRAELSAATEAAN